MCSFTNFLFIFNFFPGITSIAESGQQQDGSTVMIWWKVAQGFRRVSSSNNDNDNDNNHNNNNNNNNNNSNDDLLKGEWTITDIG